MYCASWYSLEFEDIYDVSRPAIQYNTSFKRNPLVKKIINQLTRIPTSTLDTRPHPKSDPFPSTRHRKRHRRARHEEKSRAAAGQTVCISRARRAKIQAPSCSARPFRTRPESILIRARAQERERLLWYIRARQFLSASRYWRASREIRPAAGARERAAAAAQRCGNIFGKGCRMRVMMIIGKASAARCDRGAWELGGRFNARAGALLRWIDDGFDFERRVYGWLYCLERKRGVGFA